MSLNMLLLVCVCVHITVNGRGAVIARYSVVTPITSPPTKTKKNNLSS